MANENQELEILSNVAADVRRSSRRGFLTKAAITSAAVVPATLLGQSATAAGGGVPSLYPGSTAGNFVSIRADENSHVEFLRGALGAMARPAPTVQNLLAGDFGQFVAMSTAFENLGAGAYLGALPRISNPAYVYAGGSIGLVEAYHAGFLNTLANEALTPTGAFIQRKTIPEVIQAITPYVVNLNGGPPLNFSEVPSAENDIAILNFALALEYLEQAFYNINVPRFF